MASSASPPARQRSARRFSRSAAVIAALACIAAPAALRAQGLVLGEQDDFWDLRIGLPWSDQPQNYQEFACGTNGGPPSTRLTGFGDFALCRPEATGLHEVQFRYDDTIEYWARALEAPPLIERYAGTRLLTYPVILSALFDDTGVLRGLRAVTDNRVSVTTRQLAYSMANTIRTYFGSDGWTCTDLPAAEGEEPMGRRFVKQNCWKVAEDGLTLLTQSRFLRKQGQTLLDPANDRVRVGYFESIGRLDIYDFDSRNRLFLGARRWLAPQAWVGC